MSIATSDRLRGRLRELDAGCENAGAAVLAREAEHRAAVSRAVIHNDHRATEKTAPALAAARADLQRTVEKRDEARRLLAEAMKREKEEARAAARTEIEAELAGMAATAHQLDTRFAELVGQIVRLHERETALHRKTRAHFRSPSAAPQSRGAARPMATFLGSLANGLQPDAKPFTAEVVASAAHNIRQVLDHAD